MPAKPKTETTEDKQITENAPLNQKAVDNYPEQTTPADTFTGEEPGAPDAEDAETAAAPVRATEGQETAQAPKGCGQSCTLNVVCSACWREKHPAANVRMANRLIVASDEGESHVADFID